jgi:hypothetical protein
MGPGSYWDSWAVALGLGWDSWGVAVPTTGPALAPGAKIWAVSSTTDLY